MTDLNKAILNKLRDYIHSQYLANPFASYHGGAYNRTMKCKCDQRVIQQRTNTKKNPWVEKVKEYSKKHNISYKDAMIELSKKKKSNKKGNGLIMY